ncbi:MAG: nucleotidyl transferase AbiEii/AbiGii toxin family protein [Chitinispirillaceae bacterium]|nr:nucleotidyl transferase AbiEii/AbiGii toxin family protein [Chitinispirillaceae bacterium]
MERKKYASPAAMRIALEDRLNRTARENNQDIARLRRQVAFDRLLARIFSSPLSNRMALKGGYAIELRLQKARTTKDIDMCIDDRNRTIASYDAYLLETIREAAAIELGDFFEYAIGDSILDLENAPYGGRRFPVECRMAGRRFAHFHMDIAVGDVWIDTHEELPGKQWFEFAGISAPNIPAISPEQQFAEKIHSYSLPRQTPNSRTKDLVDMVLLIEQCDLDSKQLYDAVVKTFKRRKTHELPVELEDPPKSWQTRFEKLAEEVGMHDDLDSAISKVRQLYKAIF